MKIIRIALNKPNATNIQRPTLINFITYAAKIVARKLRRGDAKKIQGFLGKSQLEFINEKENKMQLGY